ncbi:2-oxoglutarate-dependent dioxygenase AOP1 [Pyrus ussuriensis x Pyrus communis]|uniref:2-oxoglutarate-dependent dioxygenase AOP1 n=1 Tax=Pyrus ussuriensis x Pyrus communis TaxID=2448454 RepID=A0A5N5GQ88_9ROSA|nr:2-oxoglutarate-dependent dioxygenase AOP1 [Pyrus ussuriensis x Pyrus communis]
MSNGDDDITKFTINIRAAIPETRKDSYFNFQELAKTHRINRERFIMGSEGQAKLPVVDLTNAENLKPGTEAWRSTCNQVQQALEDCGCFEATYHGVPLDLHNAMFSMSNGLFDLPVETKCQKTSDKPYHSYIGQISSLPLYESLGVDYATTPEGVEKFTNMMWPAGSDEFREKVHTFSNLVAELTKLVTKMVFHNYGVQRLYESHMASTIYLLRWFQYREQKENETNVGLPPHTDKAFISILHQKEVNGLEVKTKDGQWFVAEPSPTSFVVMAGDAFMAWSNGRVPSCFHQVIMKQNKTRLSIGLFSWLNGTVQVPEELIDDKHPLSYKPFDHFSYLHFSVTPEGKQSKCAIKTYCGV